MTLPTIHLNGTSPEELSRQAEQVYDRARDLLDALRDASPNGRDYYVVPGSMPQAQDEAAKRQKDVLAIQEWAEAVIGAAQDAIVQILRELPGGAA